MHLSTYLLAAAAAMATGASAASIIAPRQNPDDGGNSSALQPWQISSANAFSPSGRPGSYPWMTLYSNITDPNELVLGTDPDDGTVVILPAGNQGLNCAAKYLREDGPYGRRWACDYTTDGYWTMEVVEVPGGYPLTNYDLKFTRVAEEIYRGRGFRRKFVGQAHFFLAKDGNLRYICGGSGVCSSNLKEEAVPVLVDVTELTEERVEGLSLELE